MTAESKRNEAMIPDIPDEKFRVIGIDENAGETLARKRIGYWQDAWRRFKENKIALVAAIILIVLIFLFSSDRQSAAMNLKKLTPMPSTRDQAQRTGLEQTIWDEIYLPVYGRQEESLSSSDWWAPLWQVSWAPSTVGLQRTLAAWWTT